MNKYEFINKLMQMYYDGLNYFKDTFKDSIYFYEDLNSEEITKRLYNSVVEFLKFEYDEIKLPLILDIKRISFDNALLHNNADLYANVLYGIATDGLAWELEDIRIEELNEN